MGFLLAAALEIKLAKMSNTQIWLAALSQLRRNLFILPVGKCIEKSASLMHL